APIGAPATGPQVEAQPNGFGVNLPQLNPPAGGNQAPVVNIPPMGNNLYVVVNQFQVFPPYNQFRQQAHQGAVANFAGPHINQFGVGGWNNPGGNANNPLLGNQAIDRGAVEQMIQDMVSMLRGLVGRAAFSWYVKLPQNSVPNWQVMEQVFHEQFYRPEPKISMADLAKISQKSTLLKEEQQKGRPAPRSTFYRDSTKPSGSRTTAVHAVDIGDIDSEERGDEVYLEEEEELAEVNLAEIILKFPEKATMGVDQNPFPNAQVNMVNANFPRPDQPRPRLDLGSSARAAAKRRAREIPADPKAKGKAKLYPEVAKVPETKGSTKEEPPKAVVLCSRCQCEVTLEVVPPKPKEPTKEPAKGLIKEPTKDQVQVGRSRSFERNTTSPAENYGPHSPRGGMEVRPNKRPLHEYQDRYERPRYQPKRRNQHAPLRYEDIDSPYLSQNRSMWVSVGEGKSRDVACISRPRPADGNGVPTFKVPNTKAGQWYRSRGPKLPPVPLSKTQTRMAQRQYATTCKAELDWADKRQAQLDRLVELREKLRLEELELDKADAVASLEVAAAEEMKIRREWVNGRVVVTAPEEPILELEAHLTGAFEANNFKVEVSEPTKKRGDKPLRVQKARATPSKVKPPVAKALAVTKVAQPTKVENKEENDQNLVQEAGDEPHEILSEPRASMGDDEKYADDEYLKDLSKEAMEHIEKERNEKMAKFENELKAAKVKVKFGDFDEVNAMVVTLPLFFESRPDQPNFMNGDVFDEVESMVQMEGAKEVEVAQEIPKEGNAQPCIVVPKKEENLPQKVCYEMPTKKMSSHLKPLYVGAHFDRVP
ncbi:unnamed protein product, partial [Prunus brigantina]